MSSLPPLKPKQIPVYSRTEAELSKLKEYPLSSLDYRLQLNLLKKKLQDTIHIPQKTLQKGGSSFNPYLTTHSNNSQLLLLLMEKNKGIAHRKPQVYFHQRPPWT